MNLVPKLSNTEGGILFPVSYGKENYKVGGVIRVVVEAKSGGVREITFITRKYLKSELHNLPVRYYVLLHATTT